MKNLTLLFLIFCLISCSSDKKKQDKPLATDTPNTTYSVSEQSRKKYFFVVLIVVKPSFAYTQGEFGLREVYEPEISVQTFPISDALAWNDDMEYQILDMYESQTRKEFGSYDETFKLRAELYGIDPYGKHSKIVSRKLYLFDTYKEASLAKRKIADDADNYIPDDIK